MGNRDKKNTVNSSKWIGIVLVLLFTQPMLAIPLGIFGGIIWIVIQGVKKSQGNSQNSTSPTRYTTRQEKFDECSQPLFCRHTDKSEHHVRRGKEIDPWDRPDIDISKYQRNR